MPDILIVGGSDTGRAPIAAALLLAKLRARNLDWSVASVGVVGHDGSPAQPEARDTAAHFGVSVDGHAARSLTEELAAADLLLAVDSGTARVARARFPAAAVLSVPELARTARDVPDPFRMQIGAWIAYIKELDEQLTAALPSLLARFGVGPAVQEPEPQPTDEPTETAAPIGSAISTAAAEPAAAVSLSERVLALAAEWPEIIRWDVVRTRLAAELDTVTRSGMAEAHAAMLRALLAMTSDPPSAGQIAALRAEFARLNTPIGSADIARVSGLVGRWPLV